MWPIYDGSHQKNITVDGVDPKHQIREVDVYDREIVFPKL